VAPWLHGQIVARDRPMADVVDELRRYYGGAIVVADGTLHGRRVTGVYNLADPVAALRAIMGAHGGSVRQVSPWLLLAF
jgi:transmembrane sensor